MALTPEFWREVLTQNWVRHTGDLFKFKPRILRSRKAAINSKQIHAETKFHSHVRDAASIRQGLHEGLRVSTSPPPWELTPRTSILSSFARSKRSVLVLSVAPDLTPRQTALESSVATRKTYVAFGCALTTFIGSTLLSKVIIWTPLLAASLISETCLQGFAWIILSGVPRPPPPPAPAPTGFQSRLHSQNLPRWQVGCSPWLCCRCF